MSYFYEKENFSMETRKLYYEDCHMASFRARVLSCEQTDKGCEVILDATAFYPEGGGQAADTGMLGNVRVFDTHEKNGQVVHYCEGPLPVGAEVQGQIDYAARFYRMQQHTGEHIVSGILFRRYGCHNVGFHMGSEVITIDLDHEVPVEDLPENEREANEAVWKNLPVSCTVPSPEELEKIAYRSKRVLPWPVRIVEVSGFDTCACCGTHVSHTGEIGVIKLISAIPFRSGTRMEMACGKQAMDLLNGCFDQNRLVSQAFSAKILETGEAAHRMIDQVEKLIYRIVGLERRIFDGIALKYTGLGDVVHFEEGLDNVAVRELADRIADSCGGLAAVFSGSDETGYAFCLVTREGDLRKLCKDMTGTLNGRGGGKPQFQQGRVNAHQEDIAAFFKK